jgi:hypothetical protein
LKEHPGFSYTIESAASAAVVAELVDEADASTTLLRRWGSS